MPLQIVRTFDITIQNLYDWAEQIRTVNLSKKGTQFAKADEIARIADDIHLSTWLTVN